MLLVAVFSTCPTCSLISVLFAEAMKNNESMKAFKRAQRATAARNIAAKAAGEGSSQVRCRVFLG